MMSLSLVQDEHGSFDLSFDGSALETEIIISLLTDSRVTDDELPAGDDDRRGWWGGAVGSKLFLLERALATRETLDRAESYSAEALQWMIDTGVARSIIPNAQWLRDGMMLLMIDVVKPDGNTQSFEFENLWSAKINAV